MIQNTHRFEMLRIELHVKEGNVSATLHVFFLTLFHNQFSVVKRDAVNSLCTDKTIISAARWAATLG